MDRSHARSQSCARPACSAPAAAILTYDYANRTVWLEPTGEPIEGASAAWFVCAMHADGLKVPVGWGLHDRRRPLVSMQGTLAS